MDDSTSIQTTHHQVGNTFRVRWKGEELQRSSRHKSYQRGSIYDDLDVNGNTYFSAFESRDFESDVTAEALRIGLEEDLQTGSLKVSRSERDERDNGYTWTITFLELMQQQVHGYDVHFEIPQLEIVGHSLTGKGVHGYSKILNNPPRSVRGKVHAFTWEDENVDAYEVSGGLWIEQAYFIPFQNQPQDFYGFSLALDKSEINDISGLYSRAVVGMPNRDSKASGINAGAVMVEDLSLLSVGFSKNIYPISEDGKRDNSSFTVNATLKSWSDSNDIIVRNTGLPFQ